MKKFCPALVSSFVAVASLSSFAQQPATAPPVAAMRDWRGPRERELLTSYIQFLRIPNVSRDTANVRRNADYLVTEMAKRGLAPRLLTAEGAAPLVYGELRSAGASHTYLFYAHYDGQPVDPSEWAFPPFEPTLTTSRIDKGGKTLSAIPGTGQIDQDIRIYARSASDDKAAIFSMMTALDALKAAHITPNANLKFIFEGEEEINSPNLDRLLKENKQLLSADVWLVCDGPEHPSGLQTVTFGARGTERLDITVYGPNHELHSGHYGNWAPNPAMMLAQLLASMKDASGHVLVRGFYDDVVPLTEVEREAIRAIPNVDARLMDEYGFSQPDGGGKRLEELINEPSLNIRGMASGHIGNDASNVVPSSATATLDLRLVKGVHQREQADRVIAHIRNQGYFVTADEPDNAMRAAHPMIARVFVGSGYDAVRNPSNLPIFQPFIRAIEEVRRPLALQPTLGGSVPLVTIEDDLNTRTVIIPLANFDNNQHTFNENVRVGHLWNAMEIFAQLFVVR